MRAKKLAGLTALGLALALTGATTSVAAAVDGPSASEAPMVAARGRAIAGQYIVVLKSGRDARSVAASAFAAPRHVYDAALNGFSATLTARYVYLDVYSNYGGAAYGLSEIQFEGTAVPEPSSALLLVMGSVLLGWRFRKK